MASRPKRDDLKRERVWRPSADNWYLHGPMFNKQGDVDPAHVQRAIDALKTMKAEGIYTHFDLFSAVVRSSSRPWWMPGYRTADPFICDAANARFQEKYRGWWKALLTTLIRPGK